jgi:hypothetical protein
MHQKTTDEILNLLEFGSLDVEGFLPWSSNYTFLVRVHNGDCESYAVYKPQQGERPLWDFAQGTLCQREQAAYIVSRDIGWHSVPPTVMREGPHGLGSVQLFIEHDPESHYFTFEGNSAYRRQLQQIALLDTIINNADRKGGHVLLESGADGIDEERLWAIDHGVCFHANHKLRTVIWEFAGAPIPQPLLDDLINYHERLVGKKQDEEPALTQLISHIEMSALIRRLERLLGRGAFQEPGPGRHYPWPPV